MIFLFLLRLTNVPRSRQTDTSSANRAAPAHAIRLLIKLGWYIFAQYQTWLVHSKLLVNQLVEKLHENSLPQRQLVRALLLPVESRNLIVTGLVHVQSYRRYQKSTRVADPQAALSAPCTRNRSRFQDWSAFPELRCNGSSRHQPVRHPHQASHHHAQGHLAGLSNPRRTSITWIA